MAEGAENSGQRDRSPAYPIIPLETALERLAQFEAHFKRSPARAEKVGDAWSMKAKAHADRIAAALRYFGLLEYQASGQGRQVTVSEEGRKYLRAQQEQTKREAIKVAALRPKQIGKFWAEWSPDRPADAACLDDLVLKNGFSEAGARDFLKVYDATISFAKLVSTDKVSVDQVDDADAGDAENGSSPATKRREVKKTMDGERELTTGLLSKGASFRLIVTGNIGVKEIDRLIAKLQLDKEILADMDEPEMSSEGLEDILDEPRKRGTN